MKLLSNAINMGAAVSAAVLAAGVIGCLHATAMADQSGYSFARLATVPGASPGPDMFDLDFEPYAINAAGNVAFVADLKASGTDIGEGVFASRKGKLQQIVGPGEPAPGGGTFLSTPEGPDLGVTPLNNDGEGAFIFLLEPNDPSEPTGFNAGVYRFSLDRPRPYPVVVPDVTPAPTGGRFAGASYNGSLNNRGDLVFSGIVPGLQQSGGAGFDGFALGLFAANAKNQIGKVVVPGDHAPGPGGKVFDDALSGWVNDNGAVAFEAHLNGEECIDFGIYCGSTGVYKRSATGKIESIAHQGDGAPGGGTYRLAFGAVINDSGDVVFIGDLTPPPDVLQTLGVYLNSKGKTTAVASPGKPMPGGGNFATTSGYGVWTARLNNSGDVAFVARLDTETGGVGDTGLYVLSHGTLKVVARTGTVLPGIGTIAQINSPLYVAGLGSNFVDVPATNDRGQIFFDAVLTDGNGVLLLATPHGS